MINSKLLSLCSLVKGNKLDYLQGDGDFRSGECLGIMGQADIIVTNPPFSLFNDYIKMLLYLNKKFLIIGNMNAANNILLFNQIKSDEIRLGFTQPKYFTDEKGLMKSFGNVVWFTNLVSKDTKPKLKLYCHYKDNKYYRYENYDAIEVNSLKKMPDDYSGKMGVPISFIKYYDPNEFRIIGIGNGRSIPEIKPISAEALKIYKQNGGTGHYTTAMKILYYYDEQGKVKFPFSRIVVQKT